MLKQAVFLVGIILLSIIAGTFLVKNDKPQDELKSIQTSIMCSNNEFALAGCTEICKEKTNISIGVKLHGGTGSCQCQKCYDGGPPINPSLKMSFDDVSNYRCDAYCKKMMKNCFDGHCDKKPGNPTGSGNCVCRYCQ
jgi:hypothetical protein